MTKEPQLYGLPRGHLGENPRSNAGDTGDAGSIPGWEDLLE